MFSAKSFIVYGLTYKSFIHFEFIFVYGIRKCSNFILLHIVVQFSQHHLLKRLSFIHCIFLPPLSKIRWPQVHGLIPGLCILCHWSLFLFLCQYHTILMTAALQYSLKSGSLIPPAPFLFLKDYFGYLGSFMFPYKLSIFLFQFCEKCHWQFDRDCIQPVDCFEQYSYFHSANSPFKKKHT